MSAPHGASNRKRSTLFALVLALVLALILPVLLLMFFESSFIYFPSKDIVDSPAAYGLDFEDLTVETSDGVRVHGWLMTPASPPRAWLLFSHGNAGNISGRPEIARPLVQRGLAVLLYDYRGYGKSEGSPNELGTYHDGEAMLAVLLARASSSKRVFLFGRSIGGGVSYELALRHPELGGIVTDATFTSVPEMARQVFPIPFVGRLVRSRYDNLAKAPQVRIPRLVLHGTEDELIPFSMGERLRDATDPPARFHPIEGAGHNDTFAVGGSDYADAIRGFVDLCLDSSEPD